MAFRDKLAAARARHRALARELEDSERLLSELEDATSEEKALAVRTVEDLAIARQVAEKVSENQTHALATARRQELRHQRKRRRLERRLAKQAPLVQAVDGNPSHLKVHRPMDLTTKLIFPGGAVLYFGLVSRLLASMGSMIYLPVAIAGLCFTLGFYFAFAWTRHRSLSLRATDQGHVALYRRRLESPLAVGDKAALRIWLSNNDPLEEAYASFWYEDKRFSSIGPLSAEDISTLRAFGEAADISIE